MFDEDMNEDEGVAVRNFALYHSSVSAELVKFGAQLDKEARALSIEQNDTITESIKYSIEDCVKRVNDLDKAIDRVYLIRNALMSEKVKALRELILRKQQRAEYVVECLEKGKEAAEQRK